MDEQLLPREFVIAAVESIRRDLKTESLKVSATRTAVTYEMPSDVDRAEVVAHYERALAGEVLFTCRSRDCGRSNGWANRVFGEAVLYGPDQNQFYRAVERDGVLIAAYVIERGNRRVYAHVEALVPEGALDAVTNTRLTRELAGDGAAIIRGVEPRRDGSLPANAAEVLGEVGGRLSIFPREEIWVVCHLYGSEPPQTLIDRSGTCAQTVVELLTRDGGPALKPFGAGPLAPRAGNQSPRVELVMPQRGGG
jgi:hypothetical protein